MTLRLRTEVVLHGRSGQRQDGVDAYADLEAGILGLQFKCVRRLTLADIEEEVAAAARFEGLVDYMVLATTERDAKLQPHRARARGIAR